MSKSEKKSDTVYAEMKRMIIEGELAPMSDISEEALRQKFNTSRTPIHEAVLRLKEESFVYIYPRKGTLVAPISISEMQQVYETRLLIEPSLVRQAVKVLTDAQLDEMKNAFTVSTDSMEGKEYIRYFTGLDDKLHRMILECSQNQFIKVAMRRAYDHQHRARIRIAEEADKFERAINDHIELVDALKAREEERAVEVIQKHLLQGKFDFSKLDYLE